MAAKGASSVGLIHFALLFFAILAIAFGIAWYMTYSDYSTAHKDHEDRQRELSVQQQLVGKQKDELTALKALIGHTQEEVGTLGGEDKTSVIWNVENDLGTLGANKQNLHLALQDMRREINDLVTRRAEAESAVREIEEKMLSLHAVSYQGEVDKQKNRADAEAQRATTADTDRNERVALADAELKQRRQEVSQLQIQIDRVQEEFDVQRTKMQNEISLLNEKNVQLREEIDKVKQVSFEQPDGVVRHVDHTTGLVWINLGTADDLPPRTTFSVYTKTHHGVGRGEDDIKGSIEVTRVIGPHLAEARILDEDYSTPISSGDPVYTPIWSPGRKHKFAIVGLIDIDGNGISDREQLHEIIQTAGGEVDIEVDDEGNTIGGNLTVHHKFVIMGEVSDPTQQIDLEKKAQAERMVEARKEIEQQARINGVRVVSLGLFLEWAGYKPQRRLWRPGDNVPWTIEEGRRGTVVDERAQVSKVYGDPSKLRPQDESSGQTSKSFGGRYSN